MTDVGNALVVDLPGDWSGDVSRDAGDDGILLHQQGMRMHADAGSSLTIICRR
jgi:hypothetical protein